MLCPVCLDIDLFEKTKTYSLFPVSRAVPLQTKQSEAAVAFQPILQLRCKIFPSLSFEVTDVCLIISSNDFISSLHCQRSVFEKKKDDLIF